MMQTYLYPHNNTFVPFRRMNSTTKIHFHPSLLLCVLVPLEIILQLFSQERSTPRIELLREGEIFDRFCSTLEEEIEFPEEEIDVEFVWRFVLEMEKILLCELSERRQYCSTEGTKNELDIA